MDQHSSYDSSIYGPNGSIALISVVASSLILVISLQRDDLSLKFYHYKYWYHLRLTLLTLP